MKLIDISKEEYSLLNRYLGQGRPDASLVFFGNEPGTSQLSIKNTIDYLTLSPKTLIKTGFLIDESYAKPTTSDFARFISRLTLALKHKDDRWVDNLSTLGKIAINDHICKSNLDKDICLVNLRPLPRPTQDTRVYSNIDVKGYNKLWNFTLKRHYTDFHKEERVYALKEFFDQTSGLIIGVGEKENKKRFFETLYPKIKFYAAELDNHKIYFNPGKIILSNYFNNRNGIKLSGLKDLFKFIISRKYI